MVSHFISVQVVYNIQLFCIFPFENEKHINICMYASYLKRCRPSPLKLLRGFLRLIFYKAGQNELLEHLCEYNDITLHKK